MKPSLFLLPLLAIALIFTGCRTSEKYARANHAADNWLASHSGSPSLNVSGSWNAGNWGVGYLKQSGSTVTGNIDSYSVKGKVVGNKLYLVFSEHNWPFYTAVLSRATSNRLEGFYSSHVPFSNKDQRPIILQRY